MRGERVRPTIVAMAAAVLLVGPTVLAFFSGGYFAPARAVAGVGGGGRGGGARLPLPPPAPPPAAAAARALADRGRPGGARRMDRAVDRMGADRRRRLRAGADRNALPRRSHRGR